MFRCYSYTIVRGRINLCLLKLQLLKQSVKIHRCVVNTVVVWLKPATRIPPQPSHTETPAHIETRTHDQCGDTIEKSQAPDDGCINVRNMLSIEEVK
jgi:hypothetical protein